MFFPDNNRFLLSQFVPDDHVPRVWEEIERSITIDIDQFAGFHISRCINLMFDPWHCRIATRVLDPADALPEIIASHDVGSSIAIHVER